MRRLLLLAALSALCCAPAWSQQDLRGGTGVFIEPPQNPPARRQRQGTSKKQQARSAVPGREEPEDIAADGGTDGAGAATTEDLMEEALGLGNEARDETPPRYEAAERSYRLAAKLAPKDPRPHIGLGNIFWDQKRLAEAAAAYRTAIQLSGPYNAKVTAEVRKRDRKAEAAERPVKGRDRKSPGIRRRVLSPAEEEKFLYASAALIGQENAYLGAALIQQGKYSGAEAELKRATAKNPDNAEWWALLGTAQLALRKYPAARRSLRSAVFLEPDSERYAALLSRAGRGASR